MWDLSSLTKDQTRTPLGKSLNHWTARKVPQSFLYTFSAGNASL